MVGMVIGLTLVFLWIGQNNLARGVLVEGEEGIFLVVAVGQDNGAQGVVVQGSRRFVQ